MKFLLNLLKKTCIIACADNFTFSNKDFVVTENVRTREYVPKVQTKLLLGDHAYFLLIHIPVLKKRLTILI